jgi:hypothetical protein
MGGIRKFFLVIVAVLLFLSFICVNLFGVLSLSLSYNNFQNQSVSVIQSSLQNFNMISQIQSSLPTIQQYCQTHSSYASNAAGYSIIIPCAAAFQGVNAILEEGAKQITQQIYYSSYNCNFLDCIKSSQAPLFLLSEKAYILWTEIFRIFLAISFVLLVLLLFLVDKKENMLLLSGILLTIPSLIFLKLDLLLNKLFSTQVFYNFLKIFFSQSFYFSLRALIIGIVLIGMGIVFKMFDIGFFISNLISKIKKPTGKQIVKKSVKSKSK